MIRIGDELEADSEFVKQRQFASKGVRVLAGCDRPCRVTAKVYLRKAIPGLGKGALIARGTRHTDAGQTK